MSFCQNFYHLDPNIPNSKTFTTFSKWQNFYSFIFLHFKFKHYLRRPGTCGKVPLSNKRPRLSPADVACLPPPLHHHRLAFAASDRARRLQWRPPLLPASRPLASTSLPGLLILHFAARASPPSALPSTPLSWTPSFLCLCCKKP
jgi:hypothetical protein